MNDTEKDTHHKPEFIYVDETQEEVEVITDPKGEYFESLNQLEKVRYPFFLRVLCFLGALLLVIVGLAFLLVTVAAFALSAMTLFRVDPLRSAAQNYWRIFRKITVFTLGGFVATFSPSFGLGIILLYFMMQGEEVDPRFSKMMGPGK